MLLQAALTFPGYPDLTVRLTAYLTDSAPAGLCKIPGQPSGDTVPIATLLREGQAAARSAALCGSSSSLPSLSQRLNTAESHSSPTYLLLQG